MTETPRSSWFGVITEPGLQLALTIAMALLIAAATFLSVVFPAAGSWIFVSTALVGAAWYSHMMRRYHAARRRNVS